MSEGLQMRRLLVLLVTATAGLALASGCGASVTVDRDADLDTDADFDGGDADVDAALLDNDGDGFTVEAGDCDDTDPEVFPGADCPCPAGWWDCNGEDRDGCEVRVEDTAPDQIADGCCDHDDPYGNALSDCDLDGHCDCYGACSVDDAYAPEYEIPECEGE